MYYPGGSYDAVARRKGTVGGEVGTPRKSSAPISSPRVSKAAPVSAARTGPVKVLVEKTAAVRIGGATRAASSTSDKRMMLDLENQNAELKVTIDQVEKEREFYFNKLREIELCVQNSADAPSVDIDQTLKDIQAIMYQTEVSVRGR
jgi:RP/EB family microtubule-associated protein